MTIEPKHRGRMQALRTLQAAVGPIVRAGLASSIGHAGRFAGVAVVHARRIWGHSFETRVGVASALVFASAVVGFQLGNRVIAAGPGATRDAISSSIGDALGHAEHAFFAGGAGGFAGGAGEFAGGAGGSLGRAGGIESMVGLSSADAMALEDGELVAQYAPVSIDALPVYDPGSESAAPIGPVFEPAMILPNRHPNRSPKNSAPASVSAVLTVASTSDDLTLVTRGEIARQESLAASLRRQGIAPAAVHLISTELRKVFDFRRSRAGDTYRLSQDADGRVLDFQYSQGLEESYSLTWKGTRYVARKQSEMLEPQIAKIAGVVDGSFYDAIMALGEQSALATEFAKILAWDMDFSRAVHPGDEFSILYERLYTKGPDGRGVYVRPGKILAGRYLGKSGEHTVVYYENGEGEGAYFRPDGSSIERAFLAAPLEFSRITSRFTNARRHPILNITRPHPGIDYAAPYGTPIFSVGEGIVEFSARQGANGNLVRIRHTGGYTSHYAHLSSFARGLKVGARVKQKQIIGYVGSTGLSTGPHVCFRVKKNGQYVDPMRVAKPAGPAIEYGRIDHFRDVRDQRLADLGRGPFVAANEAL